MSGYCLHVAFIRYLLVSATSSPGWPTFGTNSALRIIGIEINSTMALINVGVIHHLLIYYPY